MSIRLQYIYTCVLTLFNLFCSHAPSIDLVLLSHGDLAHSGLYPYASAHWGLTAPCYTTLPVQAMARIAATEDVEGIRDEQAFGEEVVEKAEAEHEVHEHVEGEETSEEPEHSDEPQDPSPSKLKKYVATVQEVHDAFDAVNVLRYSQPCHLQGTSAFVAHPSALTNCVRREVPGFDYHSTQLRTHSRWYNMEDSFSYRWYPSLRG